MVDVEKSCLSYKGTCHVILLAKLHDMYLYKTTTFPHQPLRSISKVAVLHRFYCNSWTIGFAICRFSLTETMPRPKIWKYGNHCRSSTIWDTLIKFCIHINVDKRSSQRNCQCHFLLTGQHLGQNCDSKWKWP